MDWNDVRHFLALAREGSVRGAGARLGVSHSTVARRVEALEERLAVRLFDRHRGGYTLTDAGERIRPTAERIEAEVATLQRAVAGQDERLEGPIRLTCSDSFVGDLVIDDLLALCDAHPELEVHLVADSRAYDLSRREADIALRAMAPDAQPPEHLIGQPLVPIAVSAFVAAEHAERLDPDRPASEARWISYQDRRLFQQVLLLMPWPELPVWGSFSSVELMVRAIARGLGLGIIPCYVGDSHPGLQRVTGAEPLELGALWLLSHPDLRTNARLRAARRCLRQTVATKEDLFRGLAP